MTLVRIHNATGQQLDLVRVRPPGQWADPVEYGPLAVGASSDYRDVPDARAVAAIEATGPTTELVLQPYDLVGEAPLGPGRFTYRLSTLEGRLQLEVTSDAPT